eukprot:TRINITY_DN4335_c0_g1_i1.p1 TRINITY_DN4335_c0_g1~~TRINITY_DN4335_c0_g1_i1.p1  ORF type:complete len:473 (-),score=126.78 TRINITY_DN4335_c0_g1_i1:121-1539(-)
MFMFLFLCAILAAIVAWLVTQKSSKGKSKAIDNPRGPSHYRPKKKESKNSSEGVAPLPQQSQRATLRKPKDTRSLIAHEILSTERTYVGQLHVLVSLYIFQLKNTKKWGITEGELRAMFPDIEVIYRYNHILLSDLEERLDLWDANKTMLGDVFLSFSHWLKTYQTFVNQYSDAMEIITEKLEEKGKFYKLEEEIKKKDTRCGGGVYALLITPIQRVPRYVLLLKELIKHTPATHPDHAQLSEALAKIESVANLLNESRRAAMRKAKVFQIDSHIYIPENMVSLRNSTGGSSSVMVQQPFPIPLGLVEPTRFLVRYAPYHCAIGGSTQRAVKAFLFNDSLLVAVVHEHMDDGRFSAAASSAGQSRASKRISSLATGVTTQPYKPPSLEEEDSPDTDLPPGLYEPLFFSTLDCVEIKDPGSDALSWNVTFGSLDMSLSSSSKEQKAQWLKDLRTFKAQRSKIALDKKKRISRR